MLVNLFSMLSKLLKLDPLSHCQENCYLSPLSSSSSSSSPPSPLINSLLKVKRRLGFIFNSYYLQWVHKRTELITILIFFNLEKLKHKQYYCNILFSSFHLNGGTLGFHSQTRGHPIDRFGRISVWKSFSILAKCHLKTSYVVKLIRFAIGTGIFE